MYSQRFMMFRKYINLLMLISFVSGQAVYAGALDNVLPVVFNQSVSMGKEAEVKQLSQKFPT